MTQTGEMLRFSCLHLIDSTDSSSRSRHPTPTIAMDLLCVRQAIVCAGIVQQSTAYRKCEAGTCRAWTHWSIHMVLTFYFKSHESLLSILFESDSELQRKELPAFSSCSLQSIVIPQSIETVCLLCFVSCVRFSAISFA
jgi:hypothetical protein